MAAREIRLQATSDEICEGCVNAVICTECANEHVAGCEIGANASFDRINCHCESKEAK